ncbi:MAG TPA: hypothetical protein ENN41_08880 [Sediminispirochaeta sp.]|nr:hypothetical protein [Sediminispirochaeta sp.]
MSFVFAPYALLLFLSAGITLALALYSFRRRNVPGATAFAVAMLVGVLWSLANALEIMGADLRTKLFWANLQYLSYGAAPVVWLIMVLQYGSYEG